MSIDRFEKTDDGCFIEIKGFTIIIDTDDMEVRVWADDCDHEPYATIYLRTEA